MEKMLPVTCGKYCVGDSVTIADVCLVCQRMNADRYVIVVCSYIPNRNVQMIDQWKEMSAYTGDLRQLFAAILTSFWTSFNTFMSTSILDIIFH